MDEVKTFGEIAYQIIFARHHPGKTLNFSDSSSDEDLILL
jgi:hypothetical protein